MQMRPLIWGLIKLATLILVLRFLGDMNWIASVVVGYGLAVTLSSKSTTSTASFTPFTFTLHPHVRHMLIDLGYLDESVMDEVQITDYSDPWSGAYMDRSGVTGYALQESDYMPVVYWPELKWITDGIGFDRRLEFLDPPESTPFSIAPSCFCKAANGAGLAFGLSVKKDWWKANSDAVNVTGIVLKVEEQWHFGTVDLTLAVLPPEALHWYMGPQHVTDMALLRRQEKHLKEALQENNWREKDNSDAEAWMETPTTYEHRYVTIYMNHLHRAWR